ncbi:hypothetical protein [Streptomyces sp. 8K308]|uniref:hypothetical protein n=1 Tax=Streptomyces sp. 8K308 TaxID=2530388 RepID=UPI001A9DDFA9|nr:hypothetical protein [Streptomyces sp. 8K308]
MTHCRAHDPADDRELGTAIDVTIAEPRLEALLPADAATSAMLAEPSRSAGSA